MSGSEGFPPTVGVAMLVDFHSMFFLDGEYRKLAIRSERTTSVEVMIDQRNADHPQVGTRTHLQFRELEATETESILGQNAGVVRCEQH